jgi:hypothetical protein
MEEQGSTNTLMLSMSLIRGPGVVQWLGHCAASRRASGSIPSGVTGDFFHSLWNHVPLGRLSL